MQQLNKDGTGDKWFGVRVTRFVCVWESSTRETPWHSKIQRTADEQEEEKVSQEMDAIIRWKPSDDVNKVTSKFFYVERPVFESVLISLQREIGRAQKVLNVLLSLSS